MIGLLPCFAHGINVRTASGCFTRFGSQDCPASHTRTLKGYIGGVEAYFPLSASSSNQPGGSNLVCVSDDADVVDGDYNYEYRLYQAFSDGSGGALVSTACAVCCDAGCYSTFGTKKCDDGYVTQYEGRAGGVQTVTDYADDYGSGAMAKTICVDGAAAIDDTGYSSRLMRADVSGNDVKSVDTTCATCCAKPDAKPDVTITGSCYTRWGQKGCAAGYAAVVSGYVGGLEAYVIDTSIGTPGGANVQCVDAAAAGTKSYLDDDGYEIPGHYNLHRAYDDGSNGERVATDCTVCCKGGCFESFGSAECPSGYDVAYSGTSGSMTTYHQTIDSGSQGKGLTAKTVCVDNGAVPYDKEDNAVRLVRADYAGAVLDSVATDCAMCCAPDTKQFNVTASPTTTRSPSTAAPSAAPSPMPSPSPTPAPTVTDVPTTDAPSLAPSTSLAPTPGAAFCCDRVDLTASQGGPFFPIDPHLNYSTCADFCSYQNAKGDYLYYKCDSDGCYFYWTSDEQPCEWPRAYYQSLGIYDIYRVCVNLTSSCLPETSACSADVPVPCCNGTSCEQSETNSDVYQCQKNEDKHRHRSPDVMDRVLIIIVALVAAVVFGCAAACFALRRRTNSIDYTPAPLLENDSLDDNVPLQSA